MSKILETEWNVVINVGANCDIQYITKDAKIRYYSSPFDSVETSLGLTTTSELIASKFEGYMDTHEDWFLSSASRSRRPKYTKNIKKEKWDTLYYVHIYREWLPGMGKWGWRSFNGGPPNWEGDQAWERFKTTFLNLQQRLISLLESDNKVLFLRIDSGNTKLIWPHNKQEHCDAFVENISNAYPNSNFGFYYMFHQKNDKGKEREPLVASSDKMFVESMPSRESSLDKRSHEYRRQYRAEVLKKLSKIKLLPRDEILPFNFEEKIFYKK